MHLRNWPTQSYSRFRLDVFDQSQRFPVQKSQKSADKTIPHSAHGWQLRQLRVGVSRNQNKVNNYCSSLVRLLCNKSQMFYTYIIHKRLHHHGDVFCHVKQTTAKMYATLTVAVKSNTIYIYTLFQLRIKLQSCSSRLSMTRSKRSTQLGETSETSMQPSPKNFPVLKYHLLAPLTNPQARMFTHHPLRS